MKFKWLCFLIGIVLCIGCSQIREGEWQGSIKVEDGIQVVYNPESPMYSQPIITFEQDLTIGQSQIDEDLTLSHVGSFTVDDEGNIYIMDSKPLQIKVFNSRGRFLRAFGRAGQGPGDLDVFQSLHFTNQNEILCIDGARGALQFFSVDGKFLRYAKCQELQWCRNSTVLATNHIYTVINALGEFQERLISLSPPYEKSEQIAVHPFSNQGPLPSFSLRYGVFPQGRIAWGISEKYEFHVLSDSGEIIRKIRKDYKPILLSEEYKAELAQSGPPNRSQEEWAKSIEDRLSPHFPPFDFIFADEAGNLFVKTFKIEPETGHHMIDVFDPEGRFLTKTSLETGHFIKDTWPYLYQVKNNYLYAPGYDENDFPVIKRYKISWNYPKTE